MGLDDLTQWVEDNKMSFAHWLIVDDLNHLKRGGRVSATTAFFGGMLGIKPIIHVDDEGHLITMHKCRGLKASMDHITKIMGETCIDLDTVAIAHGDCLENAQALEKILKEQYGVKNVIIGYVGGVIGRTARHLASYVIANNKKCENGYAGRIDNAENAKIQLFDACVYLIAGLFGVE
jgi:DegV family protein with EDD domain